MGDAAQGRLAPAPRRAPHVAWAPWRPAVNPARAAALIIAAIAVVEAVLVGAVLSSRTFFSGDAGVKYIQADNIVQAHWQRLSIRDPAEQIDPDGRFSALAGSQFHRRGPGAPYYGAYADLFTVLVSVGLALFGARGVYLVPMLASVGAMLFAYRLAARSARRTAWLAPLLVGACSPMLFYSVDLWEHTLAVMLSTAAVLLFVAGTAQFALSRFALAGLALGAAITVREELYALGLASLVALAWVERRRRLPAALAAGAASLVVLAPHWLLKWTQTGLPVRIAVLRLLHPFTYLPDGSVAAGRVDPPTWQSALMLLLPLSATWLLPLAAAVAARSVLPRAAPRWRTVLLVAVAVAAVLWALGDALLLGWTWSRPNALVQAFPLALFLLFLPPAPGPASAAQREIRQVLAMAAVYTAAVCAAAPFSLRTTPPGGAQWGPRFLMPVYPMLAAAILFALDRRSDWAGRVPVAPRLTAGVFALLALASAAVQAQGIRELRVAKSGYERLVATVQTLDPSGVVATDLWWLPTITATVLYDRPMVLVDVRGNGSLPELLPRLSTLGITSLTLFSERGQLDARHSTALAQAGWTEDGRRRVPIWLEVECVSYRRAPPAPG